jgi:hypothetical protein
MAAVMNTPHDFITGAMGGAKVGALVDGGAERSSLAGLLVAGERGLIATDGDEGASLFTSSRVIVAQQVGIMKKRLSVAAIRRDTILGYSIDPSSHVTLILLGAFGRATLMFDEGFDPMHLSSWLGETLAGQPSG